MKEILEAAIERKNNDVNSFVWKFAKNSGTPDIKLIDATKEQLQQFYNHCNSMLYSDNKKNPGRYTLLDVIKTYRNKCTTELFLKQMEDGSIFDDGKPYPKSLYYQDLTEIIQINKEKLPKNELKDLPISVVTQGLPRDYERLNIQMVLDGCVDMLGVLNMKHITYNFIFGLGVYLTNEEHKYLKENGNGSVIDNLKELLFINKDARVKIRSTGLSLNEFKTILELKAISARTPKKFSQLSVNELLVLRNKVLFRLEQEISGHAELWEQKIDQIRKVAELKGYELS